MRRRFLLGMAAAGAAGRGIGAMPIGSAVPGMHWERHPDPASAGFTAQRVQMLRDFVAELDTTAVQIVVGGRIVFDHGDTAHVSYLASARKSVLAMLYGRYVENGKIRLADTLASVGIDDVEGLSESERTATVEHLLTARSGIYHPASNTGDDIKFAPARGSVPPGTRHLYNNWDFNAAGGVFERTTGIDIYDAFAADIAGLIGLQDFDRARQRKTGDPSKSRYLAYHFHLSTRDMARLGLLMLRGGDWGGRRILPDGWSGRITSLVTPHEDLIPERRRQLGKDQRWGYGYMWWVWDTVDATDPMRGAYEARGLFGQRITVIPSRDMVIAHKVDRRYRVAEGQRRRVRSSQYAELVRLAS
jgi:CubicO group peptidase (beta-lactamase class C family)